MTDRPLNRENTPPPAGPRQEIWRVTPELGFKGFILSPNFWGTFVHWDYGRKRTSECLEDPEKCPGCISKMEQKWKGYLAVYCSLRQKTGFLELTANAANQLLEQVGKGKSLRGVYMNAKRAGKTSNARLLIEVNPYNTAPADLPSNMDPELTLRKLWHWVKVPSKKVD